MKKLILAIFLLGPFAGARAADVVYGPDGAPTVVQRKLYPMSGKWEATALFDIAVNTALVDQLGGVIGVSYHPNEWFDFGAEALVHHSALSTLAQNVRASAAPRTPASVRDEISNDNQLRAGAFGVARLAPIYGKFDLASELKVHFQIFALGGAGLALVHRESVNLCADPGTATCRDYQQADATRPAGLVGGGFRFYFNRAWSVTTEVRGYFFSSSYKLKNDLTQPTSGSAQGYLAAIATFDAGLSLLF